MVGVIRFWRCRNNQQLLDCFGLAGRQRVGQLNVGIFQGGLEGSVATLELRRNLAIASAKLDRHRAEQTKNEAME